MRVIKKIWHSVKTVKLWAVVSRYIYILWLLFLGRYCHLGVVTVRLGDFTSRALADKDLIISNSDNGFFVEFCWGLIEVER